MGLGSFLERFSRPKSFSRLQIAAKFLAGNGLEIGALSNPLCVPRHARVTYVDRVGLADLLTQFPELARRKVVDPQIVDDADKLTTIPDESQDFLIANHLIEHVENPTATLETFLRVVKPGGIIYLAIPDMRSTFDHRREETSAAHLLRDYREGPEWSRKDHYDEFVRCVEQIADAEARSVRVETMIRTNCNIHFHSWSQPGMWAWLNALQLELGFRFEIEFYLHRKNEGIFILKKLPGISDSAGTDHRVITRRDL